MRGGRIPYFLRRRALLIPRRGRGRTQFCGQRPHFFQKRFQALNISRHGRGGVTHTPCGGRSAPPSFWGGAAATALLGRADECRRPTQGACVSGDRSLFNQKGPPLRRAQWGTKRTGRWSGPRDKTPGGQSRHFCGNAVRHRIAGRARFDGGTMFPRKPLLFGRGILAG